MIFSYKMSSSNQNNGKNDMSRLDTLHADYLADALNATKIANAKKIIEWLQTNPRIGSLDLGGKNQRFYYFDKNNQQNSIAIFEVIQ